MKSKNPPEEPAHEDNFLESSRRDFLKHSGLLTAIAFTPSPIVKAAQSGLDEKIADLYEKVPVSLEVNGVKHQLSIEPRVTLLDLLREQLEPSRDWPKAINCTPCRKRLSSMMVFNAVIARPDRSCRLLPVSARVMPTPNRKYASI